ncbi:RHS repeat-associated core domain-containing protein [Pseudomonas sp. IT-P253]|uniref:RHS repeat-associated core domain-containing protein n=1 Tax=Pseudomonas sp. IT-P253 TaxID=3026455 RepID=UPI0039DFAF4F
MPLSPADKHAISNLSRTLLLATDNKNSVLAEIAGGKPNAIAYSAYGQPSAQQEVATGLEFNGELHEAHIGWYLLGNGYRAYNPVLMRFHSPDSWSPFGGGGLNAYMYCVGDPVNLSDPTGHFRIPSIRSVIRRSPSPPAPTRTTATANVHITPPTRSFSVAQTLSAGDALDPPPPYVPSELPSYAEAAALRAHTQLEPTSFTQRAQPVSPSPHTRSASRTGTGYMMESPNSGPTGRTRIRPAEFAIHEIGSIDSDVPPLPRPRRISDNVVRQYSMSRTPDGTWSHRSVEMVDLRNFIRRDSEH